MSVSAETARKAAATIRRFIAAAEEAVAEGRMVSAAYGPWIAGVEARLLDRLRDEADRLDGGTHESEVPMSHEVDVGKPVMNSPRRLDLGPF